MIYGKTVTRLRATQKKSAYAHGPNAGTVEDWTSPDRKLFKGVGIAPTSSVIRYTDIGAPILSGISLLFPRQIKLDIDARDRFEVNGQVWLVNGDPEEYVSPLSGYVGGTVVHLKRLEDG